MNPVQVGAAIASLRKKNNLTQAALARILCVSDKTVSKWETGQGYPEISLLPQLAAAFGVTVDNLLCGEYAGIAVIGNLHSDYVRNVDANPHPRGQANITSSTRYAGGSVSNITFNLSKIDPTIPLYAFGCVGNDADGSYILSRLQRHFIKTSGITSVNSPTGVNELISTPTDGVFLIRAAGANVMFDPQNIDVFSLTCRIAHFGRLTLFPRFWDQDEEYGCKLARVLHNLQEANIQTALSILANKQAPKSEQLALVLKYCDHVLMTAEALGSICNTTIGQEPLSDYTAIQSCMQQVLDLGVQKKVFVFIGDYIGFCLNKDGSFCSCRMKEVAPEEFVHQFGLADDISSGCLFGLYHNYPDIEILKFGLGVATVSVTSKYNDDGMRPKREIVQIINDNPSND